MERNNIEIRIIDKEKSIFTTQPIKKDTIIFEFEKKFLKHPTRTSMQIDEGIHQECNNPDAFENLLNHACNPNGYIKFSDLTYRALRNIKKGEELTFNYLTTEWDLFNKFQCHCNFTNCYGQIKGFKYLTLKQQQKLEPLLSPYLKKKLANNYIK